MKHYYCFSEDHDDARDKVKKSDQTSDLQTDNENQKRYEVKLEFFYFQFACGNCSIYSVAICAVQKKLKLCSK